MEGKRLPVDSLIESRFAESWDVFLTSMKGETYQLLERQRNASSARVLALSNLERYKSLRLRHRTSLRDGSCEGHQLRVPEDLAVVGFDDIPATK
jgi:hypothetical protein